MYIEIGKDVVEDAIAKKNSAVNESLNLLLLFALFAQKGKHIVIVPCLANDKEMVESLSAIMTVSNLYKLRIAESKSYLLPAIKAAVSEYSIVTYKDGTVVDSRAIVINPLRMSEFEPYLETRVITENLLDSIYFRFVARYYLRKNLFDGISISYDAIPGGGSTTCEAVRSELEKEKRFCLVIVDGDKKYPTQPRDPGSTAGKVEEVVKMYSSRTCKLHIMKEVMEVENLIPKRIVGKYATDKHGISILKSDFSYFDMKEGLTMKGLYNDDVYNYWKSSLTSDQKDFRKEAKANTKTRKEYEQYIDDKKFNNVIINGFGSDLLKNVTCFREVTGGIPFPELMDEMLNKIMPADLTSYQEKEWNEIGHLMFSWTCGLSERRA